MTTLEASLLVATFSIIFAALLAFVHLLLPYTKTLTRLIMYTSLTFSVSALLSAPHKAASSRKQAATI